MKRSWIHRIPALWRRAIVVVWDVLSWGLAFLLVCVVRYDLSLSTLQWRQAFAYLGAAILLFVAGGFASQLYLGRTKVGSFQDGLWVGGLALSLWLALGFISIALVDLPRGIALILPPIALVFQMAGRVVWRAIWESSQRRRTGDVTAQRALIYGAGDAGLEVVRLIDMSATSPYEVVGFVDDNPDKRFLRVKGRRVLGTGDKLRLIAESKEAEVVIFTIAAPPPHLIQDVTRACHAAGLTLVVLPPLKEMIGGHVRLEQLRKVDVADLLGRRPIKTDLDKISGYIRGKSVLITGAGGSIGSELARQVHRLGPRRLILLDRDESALHGLQLLLYGNGLLDSDDIVLCDIRDRDALLKVFERHRPEVVFHAAALKHLPMLERFPMEGWKTNVLGTRNVLDCAQRSGVSRFVNISTDKAADPTSVLGQTKRLAERLTAWHAQEHRLPYVSVRFGNVLGSRGSVLHAFRSQIERGGPVTVTHPEVTRFFMTIPEACELVLQAGVIGRPGDVMVLDMGAPVKIVDVARLLIDESGRDIEVAFTGLRPGEKLHESLFSQLENSRPSEHPLIKQVNVPPLAPQNLPLNSQDPLAALVSQGAIPLSPDSPVGLSASNFTETVAT
jgi:dTDP-glucose 4,6-dehydratase